MVRPFTDLSDKRVEANEDFLAFTQVGALGLLNAGHQLHLGEIEQL